MNLLTFYIGRTLSDINHSKILYDPHPRVMEIETINKWDLIKLKSFCTMKETINKVKRQPSEWEKIIVKETTDKELISKIYKQLHAAQHQENKQPNQKVSQRTDISPKKTYRWLTNTWKDAQHHSLSETCKSKPQWGTITHQSEKPPSKSLQTINAGEGEEKREPSYIAGGNANWYSHYGEECVDSLKNWK